MVPTDFYRSPFNTVKNCLSGPRTKSVYAASPFVFIPHYEAGLQLASFHSFVN